MQKRPVAIILFANALSAIEVCWSLNDSGYEVVAIEKKGCPSALRFSRFASTTSITAPGISVSQCSQELAEILIKIASESYKKSIALIPLDDEALYLVSRTEIPHSIRLASPGTPTVEVALDKYLQIETARKSGFDIIPTQLVSGNTTDLTIDPPAILKPRYAIHAENDKIKTAHFFPCPDRPALLEALHQVPRDGTVLQQTYVKGVGEGIFGIASHGHALALSGHQRMRMMNPEGSGSSACTSVSVSPVLADATRKFIKFSKWSGLFMIELLRDADGRVWFMEFNGRPWGSMALARRQGLEYPGWHAHLATGKKVNFPSMNSDRPPIVCRHIGREIVHLLFVMRGARKSTNLKWPSRWQTLKDLSLPQRNRHWYNLRWKDPLPFFWETFQTITSILPTKHKRR